MMAQVQTTPDRRTNADDVYDFLYGQIPSLRLLSGTCISEVLHCACKLSRPERYQQLEHDLTNHAAAIANKDVEAFHGLDCDFHTQLCEVADSALMFGTILENNGIVDRLCVLVLLEPAAMDVLYDDHLSIVEALKARDETRLIGPISLHLSRLDDVIKSIRKSHVDFFED